MDDAGNKGEVEVFRTEEEERECCNLGTKASRLCCSVRYDSGCARRRNFDGDYEALVKPRSFSVLRSDGSHLVCVDCKLK